MLKQAVCDLVSASMIWTQRGCWLMVVMVVIQYCVHASFARPEAEGIHRVKVDEAGRTWANEVQMIVQMPSEGSKQDEMGMVDEMKPHHTHTCTS